MEPGKKAAPVEWLDISLPLDEHLVSWQDEGPPQVKQYCFLDKGDPANTSMFRTDLHAGTHLDAPRHFFNEGKTVEAIDLSILMGEVYVAEIPGPLITRDALENAQIPPVQRLLFKTGNHELYEKKQFSTEYTALDVTGAQWVLERQIKLVGIDYLSIEAYGDDNFPVHKALLSQEVVILEGLNLEHAAPGFYQLMALPLKLVATEAAPVRALLVPHK
ncbi:MAG: cyclase family protein [bacterium]|nr:cyclase family protein [bacterium]